VEFTVAPMIVPGDGRSHHEWFVEFERPPADLAVFSARVDALLRGKNIYYDDLVGGNILRPLVVRPLRRNAFISYMKGLGRLGGQNKVPRLSNERVLAEGLQPYLETH